MSSEASTGNSNIERELAKLRQDIVQRVSDIVNGISVIYGKNFKTMIRMQVKLDSNIEDLIDIDLDEFEKLKDISKKVEIDPEKLIIKIDDLPVVVNPELWEQSTIGSKLYSIFVLLGYLLDYRYTEGMDNKYAKILCTIRRDLVEIAYVSVFFMVFTEISEPEELVATVSELVRSYLRSTWEGLFKGLVDFEIYFERALVHGMKLATEAVNNRNLLLIHEKAHEKAIRVFKEMAIIIANREKSQKESQSIVYLL